ncbi:tyrosine-type recombinase/integrase [Phocaeicola paurosaccharolyticus]|uniref:tyrosine-type recombinase/integrase n=1 Tax=Phocaeicola paurosaccharolyticus TaxID=732242 RepID=UPI000A046CDE|nr:site-specific integrase [Phocaeicola paurosaccharolyticus]
MKRKTLSLFARECVSQLEKEGRYSTAHLYRNSLRSYTEYLGGGEVLFSDVNRENIHSYFRHLLSSGKRPNTVSIYLRMLRSLYNQGADLGLAPHVYRLFHDVYTGIDTRHKKALGRDELFRLLYKDPGTETLRRTQQTARLLYQLCGMPFVDLSHLRSSDISEGVLEYRRIKTGSKISVKILPSAVETICALETFGRENAGPWERTPYLLAILSGKNSRGSRAEYVEYGSALRRFNSHLRALAVKVDLKGNVSSYTLRHSWATAAKRTGASIEKISESLGHRSIRTTQIYLAGFEASELAEVNRKACLYAVKRERKESVTSQVTERDP